jgi:hypothetical protein
VFYGRKNLPPSHAEYSFMHTMRKERAVRETTVRSAHCKGIDEGR